MPPEPEDVIRGVEAALQTAQREQPGAERLRLPDAVEELSIWLEDERQWYGAPGVNWASLIDDVTGALNALGKQTQQTVGSSALCDQLEECRGHLNRAETRHDFALRQRLRHLVTAIRDGCQDVETLVATWRDLTHSAAHPGPAEQAARQLLALGQWIGHDANRLRGMLSMQLIDAEARQKEEDPRPAADRLTAAETVLREPPSRADVVVWLRYIFARLLDAWIDIGDSVRIYRGEWLRSALAAPAPHHNLPPDAMSEDLKEFCEPSGEQTDEQDRPIAYVRIDVGKELTSQAVRIARDTAQTIASLGGLYGAEPTVWRLDESYVYFVDGEGGGSYAPPVVEGPTVQERIDVAEDRTSEGLQEVAERLGAHLPVRDPAVHAAATLLGWLRDARTSPAPLRLVLFDRIVEAICGWAGVSSRPRFVRSDLIPWWAYNEIRRTIMQTGFTAVWGDPAFSAAPEGSPNRERWLEIFRHPPLALAMGGERRAIDLRAVLTETPWLLDRLPPGGNGERALLELKNKTATGKATLAWWDEIRDRGERLERRRLRTRNALVHGGPLALSTVENVAPFAEHIAGEALAACVQGRLLGKDLVDYFLARARRISDVRARLKGGESAPDALFWDDDPLAI